MYYNQNPPVRPTLQAQNPMPQTPPQGGMSPAVAALMTRMNPQGVKPMPMTPPGVMPVQPGQYNQQQPFMPGPAPPGGSSYDNIGIPRSAMTAPVTTMPANMMRDNSMAAALAQNQPVRQMQSTADVIGAPVMQPNQAAQRNSQLPYAVQQRLQAFRTR